MKEYVKLLRELREEGNRNSKPDDKILIVDGLNSFIRVFSAVPVCNDDGEHIGGITGFLKSIGFVIRSVQPTRLIIVFDGKGGSVRRRDLYADYKAGRKINTKFNRPDHMEINVDQEVRNMKHQLSRLVAYLDTLPITILSIDTVEADDVIAYMTTDIFHNSEKVVIMSDDKDYLQLVNDKVSIWRPVTKTTYTAETVLEKIGVPAYNYIIFKLFTGDSSDNIKGVAGVGLKTLLKHIPEILEDKKLSLDDIIQICIDRRDSKHKFYQTILDNEKLLRLNYDLMQLEDVDIPGSIKSTVREIVNEQKIPTINKFSFKRLLMEDKVYSSFKDPDAWLMSTFNFLSGFASMKNEE
jgi:5'-3' exonuclease